MADGQESSTRYITMNAANLPSAAELGIPDDLADRRVQETGEDLGEDLLVVVAAALGVASSLDMPVRQSFVSEMVGPADLSNAVNGIMAGVFARRGVDAWVFRGDDGLDELTTATTSQVWIAHGGEVTATTIDPRDYGIARATAEDLRGGDAAHNAQVVRRLLAGDSGPVRDAVLLNAGAALAVHGAPGESVETALPAGIARATEAIDSGAAREVLSRWVAAGAS